MLGAAYFAAKQLRVVRARIFGYVSPRREDLFTSAFARQVAWVEAGLAEEVVHGSLDSIRSVLDVRDAVEAYWLAAAKGRPGEAYNIGTTSSMTVGEFLQKLIAHAKKPIKTRLDPALVRPADVTNQVPDVSKFTRETGWKPARSVDDSVDFLLAYWRSEAESVARRKPTRGPS
jgi:GDP-4-dehydro-6-deoxy-D-mannose reductase